MDIEETVIFNSDFENKNDFLFSNENIQHSYNHCNNDNQDYNNMDQMTNSNKMNFKEIVKSLLHAASSADPEIINKLLQNGADPNEHNDGFTPLMALCTNTDASVDQRLKCLQLLIESNANVDATNKQRQTPLMYACKTQPAEFIEELLKHVQNINAFDNRNKTALMYAVIARRPDIVELLLNNNVDVTCIDNNNWTAADIADYKGYTEIFDLLNPEEIQTTTIYEIENISHWKDMFPTLSNTNKHIDFEILRLLKGMGLEYYTNIFQGMDVKTFLQLTDTDLSNLGLDISVHRKQFLVDLHRFHKKKWTLRSIGNIDISLPYTIYDGVVSLGIVVKQTGVIGASFQYMNHSLLEAANENIYFSDKEIQEYEVLLEETKQSLKDLKTELLIVRTLAKKIRQKLGGQILPTYIGPKKSNGIWPVILILTFMTGIYLSKRTNILPCKIFTYFLQ